jgi:hypothetical protein
MRRFSGKHSQLSRWRVITAQQQYARKVVTATLSGSGAPGSP